MDAAAQAGGAEVQSGSALQSQLVACIQDSLAFYLYDNAIFLGERLVAQFPSEGNVFLLATCYHRSNQSYRAYHLLKGLQSPQCRYLFALCCLQLGKLTEAESALMPDNDASKVPNGAAGFHLLGRVYQLSNRHSAAIAYYITALQADPMLWSAFEELCVLGAEQETEAYVGGGGLAAGEAAPAATPAAATPAGAMQPVPSGAEPMSVTSVLPATQHVQQRAPPSALAWPLTGGEPGTAQGGLTLTPLAGAFVTPPVGGLPSGPPPAPKAAAGGRLVFPSSITPSVLGGPPPTALAPTSLAPSMGEQRKFLDDGKMRKISSKLFVEPASILRRIEAARSAAPSSPDSRAMLQLAAVQEVQPEERTPEGQTAALSLLQALGAGYRLLCLYRCREAVDAFARLPPQHYHTGWVAAQVGRAAFEMVDYPEAERAFQFARRVDPYRLKGMEYYSTVLWHMRKEVELAALAQEVVALDRLSPYAWCVMGNCFSLQKEHETALRYFQRALQLDAALPYAYTLCGHEYFANEDFEKGVTCYRNAIRIDPRHYNAWFGMGHIYYRQEKYGMAEYHFRRALSINPRSSVLRCYLGMALAKLKRGPEALSELAAAAAADPRNPLARFERAAVLVAEERLPEALAELQALRNIAPREASVLFHMGKIHKRLGQLDSALTCFSHALDLQPPSADTNLIKAAIERVGMPEEQEEEEI